MNVLVKRGWLILAIVLASGAAGCDHTPPKNVEMPPPEVDVSTPLVREVIDYEEFTGRTDAIDSVLVRARVSGYLTKIHFKDGDEVTKDQLLFEIDARPYKAQFDQDTADLANKKAIFDKTKKLYQRTLALRPSGGSTQEDEDNQGGDHEIAKAAIGQAEAKVRASKLLLDWTEVRAPISGRASRKLITEGNLVMADNTTLTSIVSLDQIYAYFFVDERTLLRLRSGSQPVSSSGDGPAAVGSAEVGLAYEEGYSLKGAINFEDNKVDSGTGTIMMRAELKNPKTAVGQWLLSPGLFARIRLPIGNPKQAVLIADRALSTDQGKKFVYVIVDKTDPKTGKLGPTVERRYIQAGGLHGGLREVLDKLGDQPLPANQKVALSERVVVSGLQRIQPGNSVLPKVVPMPAAN